MAKKLNSLVVMQTLRSQGDRIFSKLDFQRLFKVSESAVTFFLTRHCHTGLFSRLKNGLYVLSGNFPSEEVIANRLYQPSYLSFEYVLARHGIIPESVYSVTSATTKPTREFVVEGKSYEYCTIKKAAYTGYRPVTIKGEVVLMAVPEKAFADTLYFVHLKKRSVNDRWNTSKLATQKVMQYVQLFERPALLTLAREIL